MPRNPEQPPRPEVQPFPFLLSSRFESREASQVPYDTIQAIVRDKADVADFSVFRLLQNWPESMSKAPPSTKRWYVVALGYPTTYATRWCHQDREGVNCPETGKKQKKSVFMKGEKSRMFLFPRKKTQKKYDTGFSSCPNSPKLRSIYSLVAGRSGCRGSCVHAVGPPESH